MVLFLIGLGLGDARDITLKGLDAVQKCEHVYLESYTSILMQSSVADLEALYNKKVLELDRTQVEQEADKLLVEQSKLGNVALLVVGDPFSATTHTDLVARAREKDVQVEVMHNASIMTSVGVTGLQLYRFGETVSIVMWEDNWRPSSFVDKIVDNKRRGLHTLCLLDIKMKEQTVENLMKGNKIFEPPRFMSAAQAASQLLEVIENNSKESKEEKNEDKEEKKSEENERNGDEFVLSPSTICVAVARLGGSTAKIVKASLAEMAEVDMGEPLHSLIVCGQLHPIEEEALNFVDTPSSSESQNK